MNIGYHDDPKTGYGRFGIAVHDELVRQGIVDLGAIGTNDGDAPKPKGVAPVTLHLSTPPHVTGWYEGQFAAIFTMWEFSELPHGFRENVPEFHRIFVPSLQNQELFSNFHPDVRYVPLAVGPEWGYRKRQMPEDVFHVLTGGAGPRKGCPEVLRAFNTVFRGWTPKMGPRPHLTIRAKGTQSAELTPSDRVTIIAQPVSADMELELYARSHVFVSGSQGEGWGLMPHQAIAQGLPTILGNGHGHAAFAHYGIPVSVDEVPVDDYSTHWGNPGCAWVPNFYEICEKLRWVYDNYEEAANHADAASVFIAEEFSWEKTAADLIVNLPDTSDPSLHIGSVSDEWHGMPQRLYTVRVVRHSTWQVNGKLKTFDPGCVYAETWDWKERLASRGDLTNGCINPLEMGYTTPPVLPKPRCPHCDQRYGVDASLLPENLVTNG